MNCVIIMHLWNGKSAAMTDDFQENKCWNPKQWGICSPLRQAYL